MKTSTPIDWQRGCALAVGALALLVSACGAPAEEQPADPASDSATAASDDAAEARAFSEAWDAGMKEGDAAKMAAMFTEDAVRLSMDAPLRSGRAAIEEEFATDFDGATFETSNPVDEIVVVGDWGWARGTYDDVRTSTETGESTRLVGKWLTILRKTPDGWQYALDAGNENEPGATGPGLDAVTLPPAEGITRGNAADVQAVKDLTSIWIASTEERDLEAFVQSFTEDGIRMNDDAPADIGHDAIRERWVAGFVDGEDDAELTVDVVEVVGDWAWVRGHWGVTTTPTEGSVQRVVGKYVSVCRRTADGWKVQANLWNYNAPPPPLPEA